MAMNAHQRAASHNQPAIRGMREGSDSALDLAGITHVDRAHLHPERRRDGLNRSELARPRSQGGIPNDCRSRYTGRDLFEHLQPFPAQTVFVRDEPSGIAARSRARLSTKPAPTGSGTITNTTGTVRVACSNGATPALPLARMTSGASATISSVFLRM